MPKQKWLCEYCNYQFDDEKSASEHELKCAYNPKMKLCFSCKNKCTVLTSMGTDNCKLGLDFWIIEDEEVPCEKHEPDN